MLVEEADVWRRRCKLERDQNEKLRSSLDSVREHGEHFRQLAAKRRQELNEIAEALGFSEPSKVEAAQLLERIRGHVQKGGLLAEERGRDLVQVAKAAGLAVSEDAVSFAPWPIVARIAQLRAVSERAEDLLQALSKLAQVVR